LYVKPWEEGGREVRATASSSSPPKEKRGRGERKREGMRRAAAAFLRYLFIKCILFHRKKEGGEKERK